MAKEIIPSETPASKILVIRGQKVILDNDLAALYGVPTKRLNEQVRRNKERFPEDFVFQLTDEEKNEVVAICDHLKPLKFSYQLPYAFTEHGAMQAANVLNSPKAVKVGVAIVRAFIKLRELLSSHKDIQRKVEEHDGQIKYIFQVLNNLLEPPKEEPKKIGFVKGRQ